jgi:hypothetical protein
MHHGRVVRAGQMDVQSASRRRLRFYDDFEAGFYCSDWSIARSSSAPRISPCVPRSRRHANGTSHASVSHRPSHLTVPANPDHSHPRLPRDEITRPRAARLKTSRSRNGRGWSRHVLRVRRRDLYRRKRHSSRCVTEPSPIDPHTFIADSCV